MMGAVLFDTCTLAVIVCNLCCWCCVCCVVPTHCGATYC